MTVELGDVVRIVAEWDIPDGTIAQLVYHYLGTSGTTATPAQVANAAEAKLQAAWANISAVVVDHVTGAQVEVYQWDFTLNRWDGIATAQMVGIDGGSAGEMVPHGAAALVKFITEAARRQGRKYVMGIIEAQVGDGTILAATLANLALFGAELDNDLIAGGLTMMFGTFNTDPVSPLFETFSKTAGAVIAEGIVAYQRRRRPGTGI